MGAIPLVPTKASVVQWKNRGPPSLKRGFDSHYSHQNMMTWQRRQMRPPAERETEGANPSVISMQIWFNGRISPCQDDDMGSIPIVCTNAWVVK